jgi:hypothetical protein
MSAVEETVSKPEETKPSEVAPEAPSTDAAVETTIAPEVAILAKDPEVVKANLEQAEPVSTEAPEATSDAPAQEGETAHADKKEGSGLFGFLKKKTTEKKAPSKPAEAKAEPEPAAAAPPAEAPATEVNFEKMFEDGFVDYRVHGTFFG